MKIKFGHVHFIDLCGTHYRVSDEILQECLTSVAGELEQINNEIVNHVYQGEFKQTNTEANDNKSGDLS